jgi:hypothetical protein
MTAWDIETGNFAKYNLELAMSIESTDIPGIVKAQDQL